MDINENEAIYGILDGLLTCDTSILGSLFNCDYVFSFIWNKRGDRLIKKKFKIQDEVDAKMDAKIDINSIEAELTKLSSTEPFMLNSETTNKIGLGQYAKVMVAPLPENPFLKGAFAVAKENGAAWNSIDLNRLSTIVQLITKCYELNILLADSQQYVNTILESIDTAIFAISRDGTMIHFNKAAEEIFKCEADWAIGKHYFLTMSPKEKEKLRSGFDYVMRTGKSFTGHFVEMTLLNNRVVYLNPHICPWVNHDGEIIGAIGIMTDETQNKQFQDQLVRAEKMAILGQIAAQVSHEVMSPLASIRGFARIIEKNEPTGSKYKKYANTIVEQVDRLDTVIRELLDFSRPDKTNVEKVDLNEIVSNAVKHSKIRNENINIAEDYAQGLPLIDGDPKKMAQVFDNLLQNAYQSLESSGIIEVKTALSDENYVAITIRDSGCGIPRQNFNKIFDPYFTTKDNGTGLGLAIVQQIIKSHKGRIHIDSDMGIGTCFTLEFPIRRD